MLTNLKVLDVSRNNLNALPESISQCRSLEEFDASFNELIFLPNNFGGGIFNLKRLSIQLNKISNLPASISEMVSLTYVDVHFNELHGLPYSIGKLKNLEVRALPNTISQLVNISKLNLDQNPLVTPPADIIAKGIEAVMIFMISRYNNNSAAAKRVNAANDGKGRSSEWHEALLR
ncbi:hypothetical protein AgCh_018141 [Apium graveolens]